MNQESNEDWEEAVLRIEERAYEEGQGDAVRDCQAEGVAREEGLRSGFLRGFAFGLEVGFMEAVTEDELAAAGTDGEEREAAGEGGVRVGRRAAMILKLAREFPLHNEPAFDFDSKLRELRSLYKLCGSPAGPFLQNRPEAKAESTGW